MTTEQLAPFPHPETGVALEAHEDFQSALLEVEGRIAPLYRVRRALREELVKRFEPVLPERRWQSMTQEKVAHCPRCGGEVEP